LTAAYALTDYRSQEKTIRIVMVDIALPPTGVVNLFNVYVALFRSASRHSIRLLQEFDSKTLKKNMTSRFLMKIIGWQILD
ncbi:hypothetical protein EI94DRAFT_1589278, partial [Lactarius quietus]